MSKWTNVTGAIVIDTLATSAPEALYVARTVVDRLPRITGSERDAAWYLSILNGWNVSSDTDALGDRTNLWDDPEYKTFESQSLVVAALSGSLRDRVFEETLRETQKALARLASRLPIEHCSISVSEIRPEGRLSYVFDDPDWLLSMEQSDWTDKIRPPRHG